MSRETSDRYLRIRRFARECAVQFLYQADVAGTWEDLPDVTFWNRVAEEEDALFGADFDAACKFAEKLVRSVLDHREDLDKRIQAQADNWQIDRMGVVDRNILRMAAGEIEYLDEIPPTVSINEAVELAKRYGDKESGRFVNAILDSLAKGTHP